MTSAADICSALTRQEMSRRLRVGQTAISNACVEGKFPAKWFRVLQQMCGEVAIDCPIELFSFVTPPAAEDAA